MTYPETPDQGSGSPQDAARHGEGVVNISRRRIFRGVAGGAGVVMAVHAKTALGQAICQSPSAFTSGNQSPRPGTTPPPCSGGRSPGFWVQPQKFGYWEAVGALPPTFIPDLEPCPTGVSDLKASDILNQGTLLSAVVSPAPLPAPLSDYGIWYALAFPTDLTVFNTAVRGQLLRHLSAAWLNAKTFPDYPISLDQIRQMWVATGDGVGTWCPSGPTCLGAEDIIAYISGMYDINADLAPLPCKKKP